MVLGWFITFWRSYTYYHIASRVSIAETSKSIWKPNVRLLCYLSDGMNVMSIYLTMDRSFYGTLFICINFVN